MTTTSYPIKIRKLFEKFTPNSRNNFTDRDFNRLPPDDQYLVTCPSKFFWDLRVLDKATCESENFKLTFESVHAVFIKYHPICTTDSGPFSSSVFEPYFWQGNRTGKDSFSLCVVNTAYGTIDLKVSFQKKDDPDTPPLEHVYKLTTGHHKIGATTNRSSDTVSHHFWDYRSGMWGYDEP